MKALINDSRRIYSTVVALLPAISKDISAISGFISPFTLI